jgi:Na+-driven multidrug efflux pump
MLFQVAAVLLLPLVWELDGIWISGVLAELGAFVVTIAFVLKQRKKYNY